MRGIPQDIRKPFVASALLTLMLVEFVRGALILALLPNIGVDALGLTPAAIGLAISVHYFFDNILRSPMGFLADHFGQRFVLVSGLIVAAIGLIVVARATNPVSLTLGAGILGIGTSPLWPSVITTVTATASEEQKATAMGYIYIAWIIGGGAGPVVINFVLSFSYRAAFMLLICMLLLGGMLALITKPEKEIIHGDEPFLVLIEPRRYFGEIIVNLKQIRILFPGMFVQTLAIGILIPVLTPYARVVLGVSPQLQSVAMVIVGGTTAIFLPIMGRFVDRVGARPFLSGGFILAGIGLVLFTLQTSLWPAVSFMLLLALSYAMILPSWNSVLDGAIDREKRGTMWGVFMTVEGLGTATGPYIGGRLWQAFGPQAPFWASAILLGTMGLLYLFLRIPGLNRDLKPST
ncbi:MFS transporter [Sulfoacidibacillus ferrooxidans]|uniref:Glycolipid permease LtaA n=1 Tax=Sulfoacidibacillus ferrooxidans TaxID=2005001 RepID=A0A9X1V8Z3_9BACL|nr:MFS transporter [Sulfoacidibacillus ferrooxidans]MCI0183362.1 putative glycolipid permease LtaA [Sulfoacidibacillus ferrooxidans]